MAYGDAYHADASLKGKLRRRVARLAHRRPLVIAPDRPMLSFSFDDAPLTAATTGARLLEARGLRGTYYVSAGLSGQDAPMGVCAGADDYRRLAEAGHEIACHTFSHLDCGRASAAWLLFGSAVRRPAQFQRRRSPSMMPPGRKITRSMNTTPSVRFQPSPTNSDRNETSDRTGHPHPR